MSLIKTLIVVSDLKLVEIVPRQPVQNISTVAVDRISFCTILDNGKMSIIKPKVFTTSNQVGGDVRHAK